MGDILPEYLPFIKDNLYAPKQSFEYRTWKIQQRRRERDEFNTIPSEYTMVVLTNSTTDDAGELLLDVRAGVGDWTQGKAISLAIVPGQTITFAGMDAGVTVTSHSGTATVALSSGTLSCSAGGSLYDLILSDGSTYDCAQGIGSTNIIAGQIGGIVGVLVGFTFPDDWTYSILYGHEWGPHSEYILSDGITIGGEPVVGKIPPSTTGSDFDVVGNTLTNPGEGRSDFSVTGTTGDWDGVTYASTSLLHTEYYDYEFYFICPTFTPARTVVGTNIIGGFAVQVNVSGKIDIVESGVSARATSNTSLVVGELYTVRVKGNNTSRSIFIDGELDAVSSEVAAFSTSSLFYIGINRTVQQATSPIMWIKKRDILGTLIHDWLIESREDSNQPIIYDRVGGNHATLQGATLGVGGFWSVEKDGSELFRDGFRDDGTSLIPARTDGLAADGNALTSTPAKLSGTHCKIYANESLSMYDLSVLAGVDADLYLAGDAVGLTPDEWVALVTDGNLNNALMLSTYKNTIAAWNPALIEPDITKAEKYLGII